MSTPEWSLAGARSALNHYRQLIPSFADMLWCRGEVYHRNLPEEVLQQLQEEMLTVVTATPSGRDFVALLGACPKEQISRQPYFFVAMLAGFLQCAVLGTTYTRMTLIVDSYCSFRIVTLGSELEYDCHGWWQATNRIPHSEPVDMMTLVRILASLLGDREYPRHDWVEIVQVVAS